MKKRLLFVGFMCISLLVKAQTKTNQYTIRTLAFYNLENLFDTINDPNKNDEASPMMKLKGNNILFTWAGSQSPAPTHTNSLRLLPQYWYNQNLVGRGGVKTPTCANVTFAVIMGIFTRRCTQIYLQTWTKSSSSSTRKV